jgi:hypothetical protein
MVAYSIQVRPRLCSIIVPSVAIEKDHPLPEEILYVALGRI